jgi:hypothetical protein
MVQGSRSPIKGEGFLCGFIIKNPLSPWRLCRNEENAMFVILNPSPVILSEAKNLDFWLRAGSVKNLIKSRR